MAQANVSMHSQVSLLNCHKHSSDCDSIISETSLIIRVCIVFHVISTCTGWSAVLVLPIPSTVVTAIPSTAHNGSKQPFAEKCMENVKDNKKKNDTLTGTFG